MEDERIEYGKASGDVLAMLRAGDVEQAVAQLELDILALEYRIEDMRECKDDEEGIIIAEDNIETIEQEIADLKAGRKRAQVRGYDPLTAEPMGKALSAHTFKEMQHWLRDETRRVKEQKQVRRQQMMHRMARGY